MKRVAIGFALLVVVAAGAVVVVIQRGETETGHDWVEYRDRHLGWTLLHPDEWFRQGFNEGWISFHQQGLFLSNIDFTLEHPDLGRGRYTSAYDMRQMPRSSVVMQIANVSGGPIRLGCPPTATFPLSMSDVEFRRSGKFSPEWPGAFKSFSVGSQFFSMALWVGPEAPGEDRLVAARVARSLDVPPQEPCKGPGRFA